MRSFPKNSGSSCLSLKLRCVKSSVASAKSITNRGDDLRVIREWKTARASLMATSSRCSRYVTIESEASYCVLIYLFSYPALALCSELDLRGGIATFTSYSFLLRSRVKHQRVKYRSIKQGKNLAYIFDPFLNLFDRTFVLKSKKKSSAS